MRHDMLGTQHDIISRLDGLSLRQVDSILLHDLLDECLWDGVRGRLRSKSSSERKAPASWRRTHVVLQVRLEGAFLTSPTPYE